MNTEHFVEKPADGGGGKYIESDLSIHDNLILIVLETYKTKLKQKSFPSLLAQHHRG